MSDIFYDIESGCYRTYPDGDEASGNRIREEFDSKDLYIKQLQQENKKFKIQISAREKNYKKLEDNWNKLKKYIDKTKIKEFEKSYGKRYGKTFTQAEIIVCNMIKDKIKELERGVSDVKD